MGDSKWVYDFAEGSKEMRELQMSEDLSGEAITDSLPPHLESHKPQQEYIPVIADDDVRQKGRVKQKQMLISKGVYWPKKGLAGSGGATHARNAAQRNVEATAEAASSAPVCESSW